MPKYDETQAKQCIEDRIMTVKATWQNKRDLWNEIYSLYRFWTSTFSDVERGERSNIFIPMAFSIVETKLPRVVESLIGLDPFFKCEGRREKDQANAQFMSDVMQYQFTDELYAYYTLVMWWKEALIYGNSYMFVGWEKEFANLKKKYPKYYADEVIGYDYRGEEEVIYDGLALNHLDLFDCYPAPYGTRINGRLYERMPYFILRSEPTAEYLKNMSQKQDMSGSAILDKTAIDDLLNRFPHGYGEVDENRSGRMSYNKMSSTTQNDKHSPRYVMWTMFENDWWVSIIGDKLVRNKENPFGDNKIPIVNAVDTPVPHEHISIGQIEPVMKLQYYANDLENLGLDWLSKSINPGALISENHFLDPQRFMQDPDGIHIIKGSVHDAYRTIEKPNINFGYAQEAKMNLERLMDKVLGQSDISRGLSRPGQDTATEVVSLIQEANFRFNLSTKLLQHESVIPLLDLSAERNMMFWPYEKEIRKYTESGDPEFFKVPVSRLIGQYRFKMTINPIQGNKFAYAQTLIKFLDIVNASQGQNPGLVMEIGKYLQIDNIKQLLENPVQDALGVIVQAAQEGLLANSQQATLVLAKIIDVLAPPGSPQSKMFGNMQPAENEQDIAAQTGQGVSV